MAMAANSKASEMARCCSNKIFLASDSCISQTSSHDQPLPKSHETSQVLTGPKSHETSQVLTGASYSGQAYSIRHIQTSSFKLNKPMIISAKT
jgi:hypothetical protein